MLFSMWAVFPQIIFQGEYILSIRNLEAIWDDNAS